MKILVCELHLWANSASWLMLLFSSHIEKWVNCIPFSFGVFDDMLSLGGSWPESATAVLNSTQQTHVGCCCLDCV